MIRRRPSAPLRVVLRIVLGTALIGALVAVPSVALPSRADAVGTIHAPISGSGSTWSANAMDQWIRNVFANYKWTVNFDGTAGSTTGRNQFALGSTDFGVSEIPYALSGSDAPDKRPDRQFAYVPIVAGGTSFMYNLVIGGKRVTNLRLSGETVAKIFTGVITKWNDPAIAADNPKLALPAITIVPVVRSDGSGTSAQLTAWMRALYPGIWNAYCAKAGRSNCGITSNYPVVPGSAFLAQQGSSNVAGAVAKDQSVGAITYVEASYAIKTHFPIAKLLNAAGYYTEPSASNVAVSLLAAVINKDPNSPDYLTAKLSGVYTNPDPRTYPLSSYSYMIIPTALESNFTENKGLTLADFSSYFLCEGQQQAEVLGYSPLPINLAAAGLEQVQKIPGGDSTNKNISKCNNPTFSPDGTNKLAAQAPQPQACDKKGPDQCLTGTGGAKGTATAASGGAAVAGTTNSAGGDSTNTAAGNGTGNGDGATSLGGGDPVLASSPVDLPGRGVPVPTLLLMVSGAVLAACVIMLPPLLARRRQLVLAQGPSLRRQRKRRSRQAVPTVHLPASRRQRGRVVVPPEGS
ncbi:MAG TPA: phosphate ABC transporter substrate-binding protein PstS [Pseudolysinimonas sp.]|nr:phosphate ABC transporter substrate-binding protein PstS [Pseudolysinimonas sp.]